MPRFVHERAFGLGGHTPKHENYGLRALGHLGDDCVRQYFPSVPLVTMGLAFLDREAGVQQEHAFVSPVRQTTAGDGHGRKRAPQVTLKFFENITQRGGQRYAGRHGKGQTLRLAAPVVGVLTENDQTHGLWGRQLQSTQGLGREDRGTRLQALIQVSD